METSELLEIVSRGEDSFHQFKANIANVDSLAEELVAFSNSGGGQLIIGVDDKTLEITGISSPDIHRLNALISNAASQNVKPAINPTTENVSTAKGIVIVVTIQDGVSKPYMDKNGVILVKSAGDKRRATSREEIQRMFQKAGLVHGDEVPANGLSAADIDMEYFQQFYQAQNGEDIAILGVPLPRLLENMNLAHEGVLNISGALLFAKNPNVRLPTFIVKAVAFPGNDIADSQFLDSKEISGKVSDIFQRTMSFILSNLKAVQGSKGFNSIGDSEVPREALEELVVNALIHRDYFVSAPIRILVFVNRIEIISPGHLPNNLTVQNILNGNSNIRNPILASFATKMLPYRGLGSGIKRALKAYPDIELIDDRDGNAFKVLIKRL